MVGPLIALAACLCLVDAGFALCVFGGFLTRYVKRDHAIIVLLYVLLPLTLFLLGCAAMLRRVGK